MAAYRLSVSPCAMARGSAGAYWLWKSSPAAAGWPGGGYLPNPARCSRAGQAQQFKGRDCRKWISGKGENRLASSQSSCHMPARFMITWSNSSGSLAIWESNSGIRSVLPYRTTADGNHCVRSFSGHYLSPAAVWPSHPWHRWYSVTKFKQPSGQSASARCSHMPPFFPRGSPGCRNSSPMEITATRGLCRTIISAAPSAASRPICWDNVFTSFQQAGTGSHLTAALAYILPGLWSKA